MTAQYERIRQAACGQQAPPHSHLRRRQRCNRPAGHEGPHRRIRATDFKLLYEWTGDNRWLLEPAP